MKKILLCLAFIALNTFGFADENVDEVELALVEKIDWCHEQGEKLLNDAMQFKAEDLTPSQPSLFNIYMSSAQKFFELEKEYLSKLKWHRFCQTLLATAPDPD